MGQRLSSDAKTVMIVDDDRALVERLSIGLRNAGFHVTACFDGPRAVEMFPTIKPDLILMSVLLSGIDVIETIKRIRSTADTSIIMLTPKSNTVDIVTALEAGADDYVTKTFDVAGLVNRIQVRLCVARSCRNAQYPMKQPRYINYGMLVMDRERHISIECGRALHLTPVEFDLLFMLAANPGRTMSRRELLNRIWGYEEAGDIRLVNVHIQRLRRKVEKDPRNPRIVRTVRGVGYKFCIPAVRSGGSDT